MKNSIKSRMGEIELMVEVIFNGLAVRNVRITVSEPYIDTYELETSSPQPKEAIIVRLYNEILRKEEMYRFPTFQKLCNQYKRKLERISKVDTILHTSGNYLEYWDEPYRKLVRGFDYRTDMD